MCISKQIIEICFTAWDYFFFLFFFFEKNLIKEFPFNIQMLNYILNDNYLKLIFQLHYVIVS